jgi:hypothetical protein
MNHIALNRDVLAYLVKEYINDAVTYRSLSLTCKLLYELCTKQYVKQKMIIFAKVFTKDGIDNGRQLIGVRLPDKSFHGGMTVNKKTYNAQYKDMIIPLQHIEYDRGVPTKIIKFDKDGNVIKEKVIKITIPK